MSIALVIDRTMQVAGAKATVCVTANWFIHVLKERYTKTEFLRMYNESQTGEQPFHRSDIVRAILQTALDQTHYVGLDPMDIDAVYVAPSTLERFGLTEHVRQWAESRQASVVPLREPGAAAA